MILMILMLLVALVALMALVGLCWCWRWWRKAEESESRSDYPTRYWKVGTSSRSYLHRYKYCPYLRHTAEVNIHCLELCFHCENLHRKES